MLESEELKEWKLNIIFGFYIVLEYVVGIIVMKEGLLFVNILELYIDLKGKGGYVVYLYIVNDMIVVVSYFVI